MAEFAAKAYRLRETDVGAVRPHVLALRVRRDAFLKRPLLHAHGHTFSVKDVISNVANQAGGVHFNRAANQREKVYESVAYHTYIEGVPLGLYMMLPLGRAVIRSLEPLRLHLLDLPIWNSVGYNICILEQDGWLGIKFLHGSPDTMPQSAAVERQRRYEQQQVQSPAEGKSHT